MKKATFCGLMLAGTFGIASVTMKGVVASHHERSGNAIHADAAFRDGAYLDKLDARSGRKPHLAAGTWSDSRARASFIAGYR